MKSVQIPVYVGCSSSLLNIPSQSSGYHGKDGLGDFTEEAPPDRALLKSAPPAACVLVELVNASPGRAVSTLHDNYCFLCCVLLVLLPVILI